MFSKGNKLYSVFFSKCPRCHTGDFFESQNPYSLKNGRKMKKTCECCGQSYDPEPFFYTGAMYVSYAITVIITGAVFVGSILLSEGTPSFLKFFITEVLALLVMIPVTFRLARIIWINIFIKYDPKSSTTCEHS